MTSALPSLLAIAVVGHTPAIITCRTEYSTAAQVIDAWRAGTGSETCTRHYVEANPSARVEIAGKIARAGKPPRALEAALQLLEEAPAGEAGEVYAAIEQDARARRQWELAFRAAGERLFHALQEQRDDDLNLARAEAAAKAFQEHAYADAARTWMEVAFSDRAAVRSVQQAVTALRERGLVEEGEEQIRTLCGVLLSHGRAAQAIACLEGASAGGAVPERLWLVAYGARQVLRAEDIQVLGRRHRSFPEALSPIGRCMQPGNHSPGTATAGDLPLSAIETRVADGLGPEQAEQSRCLLQAAAQACVVELVTAGTCSDPSSIGRYVDLLAETSPPRALTAFMRGPLAPFLPDEFEPMVAQHARWDPGDPRVATALFNMHISLAHALSRLRIRGSRYFELAYHLARAREFWAEISHRAEMPHEFLEGIDRNESGPAALSLNGDDAKLARAPLDGLQPPPITWDVVALSDMQRGSVGQVSWG
ncbi:MAG TPA: hypothetical protein VND93_17905, partial [Myxococcales bacterium]|nr:hypothetical protein [Myxococcales bacterium]